MGRFDEPLTERFYAWELRGRGRLLFDQPVVLEPPFRPFEGHTVFPPKSPDDGRKHTPISSFLERFRQPVEPPKEDLNLRGEEPQPTYHESEELVELQLSLPLARSVPTPQVESFLRHGCRASETLALEILGTWRETLLQMVTSPRAVTRVQGAIESCFPGIVVTSARETRPTLLTAWNDTEPSFAVVELALGSEFMLPLGHPRCDLLAAVVTAWTGSEKENWLCYKFSCSRCKIIGRTVFKERSAATTAL